MYQDVQEAQLRERIGPVLTRESFGACLERIDAQDAAAAVVVILVMRWKEQERCSACCDVLLS